MYTKEITEAIVAKYKANPCRDTVEELAEDFDKPVKSIIGKLSKEGVYQRQSYVSKTGEKPITKIELVSELEDSLGFEADELAGVEKAPKLQLQKLVNVVNELVNELRERDEASLEN